MKEARELLLKHLYLQGGDGLGISDGRVYNACLDAIMEALTIPVVVVELPSKKSKEFERWTQSKGYEPAFHVFAEINKYTKCFEGYKRDGKTFSETEVLKRYNTYLLSL